MDFGVIFFRVPVLLFDTREYNTHNWFKNCEGLHLTLRHFKKIRGEQTCELLGNWRRHASGLWFTPGTICQCKQLVSSLNGAVQSISPFAPKRSSFLRTMQGPKRTLRVQWPFKEPRKKKCMHNLIKVHSTKLSIFDTLKNRVMNPQPQILFCNNPFWLRL